MDNLFQTAVNSDIWLNWKQTYMMLYQHSNNSSKQIFKAVPVFLAMGTNKQKTPAYKIKTRFWMSAM